MFNNIEHFRMNFMPKNAEKFNCELCDFKCSKKSNWDAHLITRKHKNRTNLNILEQKNAEKMPNKNHTYFCKKCNKEYTARNSLWYHEKKCQFNENNEIPLTNFISDIMKDNNEFKQLIIELCKNGINNNIITNNNNNNNNCNNKTFNLQVFLNETCKDAMNLMEFIDSIRLQLSDLENIGKLGYIEGMSEIIVNNLKLLDVTKRPVHCSDLKREVFYVKDDNKWEKENESNNKLKKAITKIQNKNINLISNWKQKYPDCIYSTSNKSDQYNKIIYEVMGGNVETKDAETKILKKIAKEVTIDKS